MTAIFTRIRVRILAIVLMAIVPAMALIYYSAAERKRQISVDIEENALRLSRFLASNLERDLSEGRGFLTATEALLQASGKGPDSCGGLLASLLDSGSVYGNLAVSGGDGRIRSSAKPFPPGASLAKLSWFGTIASHRGYMVDFDFGGQLGKEASIIMAFPVLKADGALDHALFAVMDLDWLNLLAKESRLPPGSAISVTNKKGDAVARYPDPDKWVGKSYPPSRFLKNESSGEGVALAAGIDGITRMYAYSSVHGSGDMVVHVGIRREAIWEPANRAVKRQLAALGVVGALAILAAWFASDVFLLKQVRALIQATKNLAAGRLEARSSLSYDKGELGELARAFDEMAETLQWREAQLRESETGDPAGTLFQVAENIPFPCLVLDSAFAIRAANPAARALFGETEESLLGRSLPSCFPGASGEGLRMRLAQTSFPASLPKSAKTEAGLAGRGGPPRTVEITLSRPGPRDNTLTFAVLRVIEESRRGD